MDEPADPMIREVHMELWHLIRFFKELIHYGYKGFDLRKKMPNLIN